MKAKKLKLTLLVVLVLLSFVLTGYSSEDKSKIKVPEVLQDVYVYDQGKFLDDEVETKINNMLVELEDKTTIEFAVITIPSLEDLSIESYAVKLANELGIGKADEDNGILLLISKEDTKVRLEIGKGLQGILTDSVSGRTLDDFFVPHREEGNYDKAAFNTVQGIINYLAESDEYDFSIEGINKDIIVEEEEDISLGTIILIIIGLIILEFITGHLFGDGFGDGIVFMVITSSSSSSSSGSSRGRFGGGGFNGGGASR